MAALVVTVAVPVFVSRTIWDLGHLFATLFGLATAALVLLAAPPRTPPPLTEPWARSTDKGRRAGMSG